MTKNKTRRTLLVLGGAGLFVWGANSAVRYFTSGGFDFEALVDPAGFRRVHLETSHGERLIRLSVSMHPSRRYLVYLMRTCATLSSKMFDRERCRWHHSLTTFVHIAAF